MLYVIHLPLPLIDPPHLIWSMKLFKDLLVFMGYLNSCCAFS